VPIVLVILSGVLSLSVLGLGFYVLLTTRYRDAEPAWRSVASGLGGEVVRAPTSLILLAVVDGRPIKVATVQRGRGRKARTFTIVGASLRHPDDVLAGAPRPASTVEAWTDAWQRAANEVDDRRLPTSSTGTRHIEGIPTKADELRAAIDEHLATIRSREERVLAWVAAGAELGLSSRAAYRLEGTSNEREVVIGGDLISRTITVRAKSVQQREHDDLVIAKADVDGVHHLDLVEDVELPGGFVLYGEDRGRTYERYKPVRAIIGQLDDTVVIRADRNGASAQLQGLTPDVAAWRRALDVVTKLA
jgi:hypothetical protein